MSDSYGNNNKSSLLDAAVDCRISDEVSLLHDDEVSTVTFGIGIVSENSGCSSDGNDEEIEDCNLSFVSSNKSPCYRNSGNGRKTTAFEERGEAISSDDDNESDAAQSNEKTRTPNVPKESNGKELEEGEIEDDSDDEVPVEAKRKDNFQHIERPRLSFETDRGEKRRKRRTYFSKAANDKQASDVKFRRLSTPTVEPISSDSDGTDGPQELQMRSTLGAELRRTKSRDSKARLRT